MAVGSLQSEIEKASKLGFAEGAKGNPPPDATAPDLNEAKFFNKAVTLLNGYASAIGPKINSLRKRVAEIAAKLVGVSAELDSLRNRTSLQSQIESRLEESFGTMVDARRTHLLRDAELNAFRLTNGLQQAAHYPSDMARHLSWVAVALAVETVVNAAFFAGANGLIQGALVAFAVAAVNLGLSFFAGVCLRGRNSVVGSKRALAWAIVITLSVMLLGVNLLTAAYRSASTALLQQLLATDPLAISVSSTEAFGQALTAIAGIVHGHFPFAELNGFILMFVGVLAAILGMWKGYTADDPYPGYGHVSRVAKKAADAYLALEASVKGDARRAGDEPLRRIVDARQGIVSLKQAGGAVRKDGRDLQHEWEQGLSQLRHEYQSLTDVYRKSVKAVKPNGVPAYFEDPVDLPGHDSVEHGFVQFRAQLDEVERDLEALAEEGLPFLAEAEQALNDERATLLGNVLSAYFERVTQTARAGIAAKPSTGFGPVAADAA